MTELHQSVKEWLHDQKDWLQRAAELLLENSNLEEQNIVALVALLKTDQGQAVPAGQRSFNGLSADANSKCSIRLKSLGDIVGIENFGQSATLDFGQGNLCVVYGNNGSGKSGYARLIKRASGQPAAKPLRANVFKATPEMQRCRIAFNDGVDKYVEWDCAGAAIEDLRVVDVFDSEVAAGYLTRDNQATYTPPIVFLFDRLVGVANAVRDLLRTEQAALQTALPLIPEHFASTKTGGIYRELDAGVESEIARIQAWSDAEKDALRFLNERLAVADPAASAKQKRATKAQIEQLVSGINQDAEAFTDESIASVRSKRSNAASARKIAQEAGQVASSELDGVGSETWKALWEAAKTYSQIPYPDRDFPVVDDARCLLCHQEITGQAKDRLRDFEAFVQGDLEKAAKEAESSYRTALEQLPTPLVDDVVVERCNSAGLIDEVMVDGLRSFWRGVAKSREALTNHERDSEVTPVELPKHYVEALKARVGALEEEAEQHDQDAANFDRTQASRQKLELEAWQWTSQQSGAIKAELQRLKDVAQYDAWVKLTHTQQITVKGGQVAEAAITDGYVARFNNELKKLGAKRIRVKLVKTRSEKGKAFHGVLLDGAIDGDAKVVNVLSDGERRIICLAAFLADVADKPHASTFVFDDPISSLDQDFEIAVARRLVELAGSRQVVVFTHRLSLYGALEDVARKMGKDDAGKEWKDKHLEQRCIESFSDACGLSVAQPILASKTDTANNTLLTRLDAAKKQGEAHGAETYRALAQGICSDFRKLLERTVEVDLLNEVVIRHRKSVTTDGRISRLSNIGQEDCQLIDALMTKYSTFEHSQSNEISVEIPEEPELRGDLESLKNWRSAFKKRAVSSLVGV